MLKAMMRCFLPSLMYNVDLVCLDIVIVPVMMNPISAPSHGFEWLCLPVGKNFITWSLFAIGRIRRSENFPRRSGVISYILWINLHNSIQLFSVTSPFVSTEAPLPRAVAFTPFLILQYFSHWMESINPDLDKPGCPRLRREHLEAKLRRSQQAMIAEIGWVLLAGASCKRCINGWIPVQSRELSSFYPIWSSSLISMSHSALQVQHARPIDILQDPRCAMDGRAERKTHPHTEND